MTQLLIVQTAKQTISKMVGQTDEKGQVIGIQILVKGTAVNPRSYITSESAYNMGTVCS